MVRNECRRTMSTVRLCRGTQATSPPAKDTGDAALQLGQPQQPGSAQDPPMTRHGLAPFTPGVPAQATRPAPSSFVALLVCRRPAQPTFARRRSTSTEQIDAGKGRNILVGHWKWSR